MVGLTQTSHGQTCKTTIIRLGEEEAIHWLQLARFAVPFCA
jgi:hypothetical protein